MGCNGSKGADSKVQPEGSSGKIQSGRKYDVILFDLDDTLYPFSLGIAEACRQNIEEYMIEKLEIAREVAIELATTLYQCHGTTMAGLSASGYSIDYDEFHSYVHGRLPYYLLKEEKKLRELILSMPQRKYIFTNADKSHAHKVLNNMGLDGCFDDIICFETIMGHPTQEIAVNVAKGDLNIHENELAIVETNDNVAVVYEEEENHKVAAVICKPSPEAMRRAIQIIQTPAARVLYLDDSIRNIVSGKTAGFETVLVGNIEKIEGADFSIDNIHDLKELIPSIWN